MRWPKRLGCVLLVTGVWLSAGTASATSEQLSIELVEVGQTAGTRSLSLSRGKPSAPEFVSALRARVMGPSHELPKTVLIESRSELGSLLQSIELGLTACPDAPETCRQTAAIALFGDRLDQQSASSTTQSLVARSGGAITASAQRASVTAQVGGPEELSRRRHRVKLSVTLLRGHDAGIPAVSGDAAQAMELIRQEVWEASGIFGQCGVSLEMERPLQIASLNEQRMVVVGCGQAILASGGEVGFHAGGRPVSVRTVLGQSPAEVVARLAAAVSRLGMTLEVFRNPVLESESVAGFDIGVRSSQGQLLPLEPMFGGKMSVDPTLSICPLRAELGDGVSYFLDHDAASGTREERALLRHFQDGDGATVDLIVVPSFSGAGRLGESFIHTGGTSLAGAVILDRAGLRAGGRSATLAHELGHVLLDLPGHPDDYGVDLGSSLMDSDASDASMHGPRRLTLSDCQRMVRQSGPPSPTNYLEVVTEE